MLRKMIMLSVVFAMILGMMVILPSTASAASFDPNQYFKLVNRASGKCLDNLGATTDGANVCQWGSGSSYNQQWKIQDAGSGYFKLVCRTGGKFLDSMGRTTDGSIVCQYSSSTSNNQQWQIVDNGGGYYKIVNRANGKCLDTGGMTADGDAMQMWGSGASYNQLWQIVDATTMYSAYLLTYFMGSKSAIYFAYSRDALHWTALNGGNPILTSTIGTQNIRDPFTMRGNDGVYHAMGTDNWASTSIVMYDSTDLINWTGQRLCNIAPATATFAWAPECQYDSSIGKYRIYFAANPNNGTHKMYTTTTSDFNTFTASTSFYDPGSGLYAIDGTILPYNGKQYMFFKYSDPGPAGKGIQRVEATTLAGPWSSKAGPFTANDVEGPAVFKDNAQTKWYMYCDYYTQGYWVLYTATALNGSWTSVSSGSFAVPSGARHGNVMPITEVELNRLIAKWGT